MLFVNITRNISKSFLYGVILFLFFLLIFNSKSPCSTTNNLEQKEVPVITYQERVDKDMPLIFIGGMPRSGTTLARAMLDAHADIRCGEETRVVPRILQMRSQWMKSAKETTRLKEAGLTKDVINDAVSAFILEVITKHGEPAPYLCNKDPFTLKSASYLASLFPRAKFIFMVRDGRATVHSIISRKVTITGFDLSDFRQCMIKWNAAVKIMNDQCNELGNKRCLKVPYEQLVLHPKMWMQKVLEFLGIRWDDAVLHHEKLINQPGGVSLSKVERSSDQVIKPVYLDALSRWVGTIPQDVMEDMGSIAPMLLELGYDPNANPPKYGEPDPEILKNTKLIKDEEDKWKQKAENVLRFTN